MADVEYNLDIEKLGEAKIPSPMKGVVFTKDGNTLLYESHADVVSEMLQKKKKLAAFECAGPRKEIFFDPKKVKAGIVTCGGLCPGLNDVIRAVVLSLYHHYGVDRVFGFPFGYEGLNPKCGHEPIELTLRKIDNIEDRGGTILGSSRGPQPIDEMVNTLERMGISILFVVGGDGTLRGGQAIAQEVKKRGLNISVMGIPKTIDNDISFIRSSFGFQTAVSEARKAINVAHTEAEAAKNGVGLVRVMGRDSGFIAALATLADSNVNYCLIPESPFSLESLLGSLKARLEKRGHAVIIVAEGAGQDLLKNANVQDASGNVRHGDIGIFLRDQIKAYFGRQHKEVTMRYIDPSYTIRGVPANAYDSAFCLLLGHNAVHAAMAGRTNMVVGFWNHEFTHVPISCATSERKKIDPNSWMWSSVLSTTGQPKDLS